MMHLLLILCCAAKAVTAELQTVHEWKYLDFLWDSEEHKLAATKSGEYNFTRVLPSDLAVAKGTLIYTYSELEIFDSIVTVVRMHTSAISLGSFLFRARC